MVYSNQHSQDLLRNHNLLKLCIVIIIGRLFYFFIEKRNNRFNIRFREITIRKHITNQYPDAIFISREVIIRNINNNSVTRGEILAYKFGGVIGYFILWISRQHLTNPNIQINVDSTNINDWHVNTDDLLNLFGPPPPPAPIQVQRKILSINTILFYGFYLLFTIYVMNYSFW